MEASLGQVIVCGLDDDVITRLKRLAEANVRSTEAEHRAILKAATRPSAEARLERARHFVAEAKETGATGTHILRNIRDARALRH